MAGPTHSQHSAVWILKAPSLNRELGVQRLKTPEPTLAAVEQYSRVTLGPGRLRVCSFCLFLQRSVREAGVESGRELVSELTKLHHSESEAVSAGRS